MEQGKMSILCDVRIKSSLREQFQNDDSQIPASKDKQPREERWGTVLLWALMKVYGERSTAADEECDP
jgi:hypothetical protein